jgi:hypothetical protein
MTTGAGIPCHTALPAYVIGKPEVTALPLHMGGGYTRCLADDIRIGLPLSLPHCPISTLIQVCIEE